MPISIYPPILQSTQVAFPADTSVYNIRFNLQKVTTVNEVKAGHIQIRIMQQSNNKTVVSTNYKDGTIYKPGSDLDESNYATDGYYQIAINRSDLNSRYAWLPDTFYKIQMRFGTTPMYSSTSEFATWKQQQIDNQTFSEWSTVMLVKAITPPNPQIVNAGDVYTDVISTDQLEPTLTPLFIGVTSSSSEIIKSYKFDLYKGEVILEDIKFTDKLDTSDWQEHRANKQDQWRFKRILEDEEQYTVIYSIITENGYAATATPYTFKVARTHLREPIDQVHLIIDSEDRYCKDNGCINIKLTIDTSFSGCLVLTRASERDNYAFYDDLKYFTFSQAQFEEQLIYRDFTVESGVKYKYVIQLENSAGLRSSPPSDLDTSPHWVDFEYSYLFHNGVQLRLMYNQKLSSFKHTTLTSKQDTLGDKYPHLVRNGYAYYAEFPISGTISFQMDQEDNTFFDTSSIARDKFRRIAFKEEQLEFDPVINSNLTDNNIFIERRFREKAEEFLNNFDYKLYKSPTEGNIVVVLHNVSLTPNTTVNRMIYDFNATAYEVLENTIPNLDKFGIIEIGHFQQRTSDTSRSTSFGQIIGLYTTNEVTSIDIYEQIKQQEELELGNEDKLFLQYLNQFWVERYPHISYTNEIMELRSQLTELEIVGDKEKVEEVRELIDTYTKLDNAIQQAAPQSPILLEVNGSPIVVAPNKIYSVKEPIKSLKLTKSPYPIIINYICTLNQDVNPDIGVPSSIDSSRIWGQVSGIFTGTDSILRQYKYDYGKGNPPWRIYNDPILKDDRVGHVVIDSTNYNVYKTINLYDIIEEEVRHQVEYIYSVTEGFSYNEKQKAWLNAAGTIEYAFDQIEAIDIETDPGTIILIGKDVSSAVPVRVNLNGRYVIKPTDGMIKYIAFKDGCYALVNYKCTTTATKIKKGV